MTNELTPKILRNQFVLSRAVRSDLPEWRQHSAAGWVLQTHPTLPVMEIRNEEDAFGGWLLGYPFERNGLLRGGDVVRPPKTASDFMVSCEEYLGSLAGRWLAIVSAPGESRVYLDPSGSLAAVYSVEEPVLCSTPSVIGKGSADADWDTELVASLPMRWYPFGLTPHRTLRRLLSNHYLDLERWRVVRHWPDPADLASSGDIEALVTQSIDILSGIVAVGVQAGAYMTLTAGWDTRVLLACSRPVASDAAYFTSTGNRMDVQAASELTKRLGLRHLFVRDRRATEAENAARLYIAGYSTDFGSWNRIGDHLQQLDPSRLQITGHGGHIGRGSKQPEAEFKVEPETIIETLHLPTTPRLLSEAAAWHEEVSHLGAHNILDLTFLEIRLPGWAGPNQYAIDGLSLSTVHGYSHRELFRLMMCLPVQYRKSQAFLTDICRRTWPETLEVPINQPWGVPRLLTYAGRAGKKMRSLRTTN